MVTYEKDDFFDSLSNEVSERQAKSRKSYSQQMRTDMETFGGAGGNRGGDGRRGGYHNNGGNRRSRNTNSNWKNKGHNNN